MSNASPVAISHIEKIILVEFTNTRILDEANIAQIRAAISAQIEPADMPQLLIDFSNVDHLSSSALGMVIDIRKKVLDRNGKIRLCSIKPHLLEAFVITRLDKLLKILPDRPAAIASFKD